MTSLGHGVWVQGNGSCMHVCVGDVRVRKLSKSLLKLIYSFRNACVTRYIPRKTVRMTLSEAREACPWGIKLTQCVYEY